MAGQGRILIFDLDGTLIDSMAPLTELFCEILVERCGIPAELSLPVYTLLLGKGPRAQFAEVLRRAEVRDEALVEKITADYWEIAESFEAAAFPETLDVLTELRSQGHTLVVSSGGHSASVERKTRTAGIAPLFNLILGSDEGVADMAKGPGHFRLVREALGLRDGELRERGVLIGDGVYDMRVAVEAGIAAVGRVTAGNGAALLEAGAAHLVSDLRELAGVLRAL